MKLGVVINTKSDNYGDDIQTIAASKLLPHVDYYLDRESLNKPPTFEKIKFISNGWFMYNPENWPPAKNLYPLFISFHVSHNNNGDKVMVNKGLYDYYKKYEPIGCRDLHTLNLFKSLGIKSYLSGCVTLTLENQFTDIDRTEDIIFVDPIISTIPKKFREKILNELVPDSILKKSTFISHYHEKTFSNEFRLKYANKLLEKYSKAHLIVTSRIHAALPAIALGTPVLFLDIGFNTYNDRNRFGGLIDYFNILDNKTFPFMKDDIIGKFYRKLRLYNLFYKIKPIKFNWENPPRPSGEFKELSNIIKNKVNDFLNE